MSRNSIEARLERLEEYAQQRQDLPAHWPADEWPVEDQVEDVLDYLNFHRTFETAALCTDREINLLGIVAAYEQLGGAGEWVASSGTAITLADNGDGTYSVELSANSAVEDLPEGVREHVERMTAKRQEKREQERFGGWRERSRERAEQPERLKRQEHERQARREKSKRRDRELLQRNRASVGLPPLTPEQIKEWGLELEGEGGNSKCPNVPE